MRPAGYPGELFLNALQELVLPLIALALLNGVLSLRHSTAGCAQCCCISSCTCCYKLSVLCLLLATVWHSAVQRMPS